MEGRHVVRRAEPQEYDLENLVHIAQLAFEDSRYAHHSFDASRVRAAIETALRDSGSAVGFILGRSGSPPADASANGALLAVAGPLTAARATICNAPLFYVKREYRKGGAADLLLTAYLDWAQSVGAYDASIPVMSGDRDVKRVGRWLQRRGLDHIGDNFSKRL